MSQILASLGFFCCAIAVIFFGVSFVPVKGVDSGDGFFFQWVLCLGVFITGLIVEAIQRFPPVNLPALLGGGLWTTGNLMTVPIIQKIGIGMGTLLWGMTNMLTGWAAGTFGLFGVTKNIISTPVLNYLGVFFAVVSLSIYLLVKTEDTVKPRSNDDRIEPLLTSCLPAAESFNEPTSVGKEKEKDESNSAAQATKVAGSLMALLAGLFYGTSLIPMQNVIDHGGDQDPLNYVFSVFLGIFSSSSVYLGCYVIFRKLRGQEPFFRKNIVGPGLVSGIMWSVAEVSWFIANQALGFSIAFPIITTGPGLLALLLGILAFK